MKKSLLVGAVAVCLSVSVYAAEFINVLTGGTSGIYYPLGVALSQMYAKAIPDSKTAVQATKASVENLNLLQAGRGEVGISLGDSFSDAYKGDADAGFKAPLSKLRTISALYPNYIHFVAAADSGIKSFADIKGKRISVGAPKSGTALNSKKILEAAGIDYKDFSRVEYLSYAESVELMKNRQLDVTLLSSGAGVAALRDLATSQKVVFLTIPEEIVTKIGDPAYQVGIIPANTYEGQTEDVKTVSVQNFLVTHAGVSEQTVYTMTKTMFENLDQMVAAHAAAKGIKLENAAKNPPAPLHPGAARYYKEVGILK
ncbi:TAXI family TRAP transporter solute-binding subunit [Sulfurospirillum multivorans]|uniref:TRAP transporter solute receptor n=2 Tax=Sulfurospirillum multivorans TaxID=66821 RepID=A0AA86DXN7_SULMK|nr:TAXI family TRAP transporter solute-binding subunit [Sulfurospirillum multivorans]AHJ12248.1 TRAP transporter solute receptor [Sulfurospirillum multivorans DSM 12446]QEH05746.1 TRAP transporter solute receptor [Sulfurospirillum multivorans]